MGTYAWSTTNTKLAAILGYLQFPIQPDKTLDERSGNIAIQFFIGDVSVTEPAIGRDALLKDHKEGTLEAREPLHAFLQGCRVQHNYERLLEAQKTGRKLRLVGVGDSHATEYRDGQEVPEMVNAREIFRLADLSLVAALGTLGVPCINIEHNGIHHIYTLPVEGLPLRMSDGSVGRYNGLNLAMRQDGSKDLLLEARDPNHPLMHAYGVRQVHGQLRRAVERSVGQVLLRPEGTKRMAFISANAPAHTLDYVFKQFKI